MGERNWVREIELEEDPTTGATLLPVNLDESFIRWEAIRYSPSIGFLAARGIGEGVVEAIGFYSPYESATDLPRSLEPITTLGELPPSERKPDRLAAGVGFRLYNAPPATMAMRAKPRAIGAYVFPVTGVDIFDMRQSHDAARGGRVPQAGRAVRWLEGIFVPGGLRRITNRAHASYEPADLVLMNQPPDAARRQHARRYPDVPGLPPAFMIVRNATLRPIKVGEVRESFFRPVGSGRSHRQTRRYF